MQSTCLTHRRASNDISPAHTCSLVIIGVNKAFSRYDVVMLTKSTHGEATEDLKGYEMFEDGDIISISRKYCDNDVQLVHHYHGEFVWYQFYQWPHHSASHGP